VRLVIADTGPINYLIQIGHIDILPRMFERVALPSAVHAELADLDEGETAAIALASGIPPRRPLAD
jgi:predicted nucleic acid-binding protein